MDETHIIPISDKSTASQPSDKDRPWAQFSAELRTYVVSNLAASVVTAWSVFLFVGGLFFLVYFASIGFMPEIDLKTSVALLAVSALTGGFLLLILGVYLLAPGLIWVLNANLRESLKSPTWFKLPMGGVIFGLILSAFLIPQWTNIIFYFFILIPLPFLLLYGIELKKLYYKPNIWQRLRIKKPYLFFIKMLRKLKPIVMRVGGFYFIFLMSIAPLVVPFLIMGVYLGKNPESTTKDLTVVLSVGLLIWITNSLLVESFSISRYLALFATNLFFFFLLLGIGTLIPNRMISIYKFGNLPNASLVLDETGCSIVQHHGVKVTPYTPNSTTATTPSPKTCSLSKVTIHSRLGSTYYLEAPHNENTSVHFTIPAQRVLSWAVDESKAVTTAGSSTSTQNPATTTPTTPPSKGMEPTH
jgi:hypothetical protein